MTDLTWQIVVAQDFRYIPSRLVTYCILGSVIVVAHALHTRKLAVAQAIHYKNNATSRCAPYKVVAQVFLYHNTSR